MGKQNAPRPHRSVSCMRAEARPPGSILAIDIVVRGDTPFRRCGCFPYRQYDVIVAP